MYKNYIFDLYGTLVDIHTDEEAHELWEKLSAFYAFQGAFYTPFELKSSYCRLVDAALLAPSVHTEIEIRIETIFRTIYTAKNVTPSDELLLYTCQFFRLLSTDYLALYDGAKELLTALHNAGGKIYLLSNAQRIFTEYEMKLLGIFHKFDGILYSSDALCQKPDHDFYDELFKTFHLKKKGSIMIGNDPITDIKGASSYGLDTFYLHSNQSPDIATLPDATFIQSPIDLYKVKTTLLGEQ